MSFELTPCEPWTSAADVKACDAYAELDDAALVLPIAIASELLYRLSGLQFPGNCTDTFRPLQAAGCGCGCGAGYGRAFEFDVGDWPVRSVTEIKVNGQSLDPTSTCVIHDGRWLIRTDGFGWPSTQILWKPTTEYGTWEVTIEAGQSPPPSGGYAASVLAGELALSCGSEEQRTCCRLSKRVQQVTRQGLTMMLIDPFQFLDKRRLGLVEVDSFIMTYNPEGLAGEPIVASPDVTPTAVRQTWP